jgi:hypothetical protein
MLPTNSLVLLCEITLKARRSGLGSGSRPPRRIAARGGVPVVDPRLFVTPQHLADHFGDASRPRRGFPQ